MPQLYRGMVIRSSEKLFEGMAVVDKIEGVKTASRGYMGDVPVNPVIIEKISVK